MKGVILALCSKTVDAAGIAQLFFNFVFKQFRLHDTLISDCSPQFASTYCALLRERELIAQLFFLVFIISFYIFFSLEVVQLSIVQSG